jgi:subtilase family serine protease
MKASIFRVFGIVALCVIAGYAEASAQTVPLTGTVSPEVSRLPNYGDLPASQNLQLKIWFKHRHQDQLNKLLADQQDPKSAQYHQWLTAQEFSERFGVNPQEFEKVSDWLRREGFQVTGGSPSAGTIQFKGSVLNIARVFSTRLSRFSADGAKFGNIIEPQLPAEYAGLISNITGLNNMFAPKIPDHPQPNFSPAANVIVGNAGPNLGPSDFYAFYDETPLTNAGITGSGCIAILGFSDFITPPIAAFNQQFGLPDDSTAISKVLANGTNPGVNIDLEGETDLDLEWSHAVAPGAAIKYFLENSVSDPPGVDSLHAAVTDNSCAVISSSISFCAGPSTPASIYTVTINNIVQQAQAQGQTILFAAGDHGAAGDVLGPVKCEVGTSPHVDEFASNPLITSVGGTSFDTSAFDAAGNITSHSATERVWDDPNDGVPNGGATGGGVSAIFAKPAFQNGVTPNDGARDQPDVALVASPYFPGSFVFDDDGSGGSQLGIVGGTSIATPMWAGIVDLLVQKTGTRLGSINGRVYQIASAGQAAAGFFDVTMGNNSFAGVTGFNAGPGYDQTTGWGSVDINQFVTAMGATPTGTPTPTPAPTPAPTTTPTPKVPASLPLSQGGPNCGNTKDRKSTPLNTTHQQTTRMPTKA